MVTHQRMFTDYAEFLFHEFFLPRADLAFLAQYFARAEAPSLSRVQKWELPGVKAGPQFGRCILESIARKVLSRK